MLPIETMNEQDPPASAENRLSETESSPTPRGTFTGKIGAKLGSSARWEQPRQPPSEAKQLQIVVRVTVSQQREIVSDGENSFAA
jgi:hypothetical protein